MLVSALAVASPCGEINDLVRVLAPDFARDTLERIAKDYACFELREDR